MDPNSTNSSSLPTPEPAAGGAMLAAPAATGGLPAASAPADVPSAAADTDRIEQEWVLKTKQLLLATRNDPYAQNQQLAALKADYMMKRYGKELKTGE